MRTPEQEIAVIAFGRTLRRLRHGYGVSQERLATISGLHRTEISLIERGHRNVRLTTFYVLADALEITAAELGAELEKDRGRGRG